MDSSIDFNQTSTTILPEEDPLPFEKFSPTLAQCFFITLAGYCAGKFELLSASDLRGVSRFASYFAMPAIICVSLCDSDLPNLGWQLLVGIVLGKVAIFVIVAGFTFFMARDSALAAMLAMFSVQCNDLPVGNPLMSSLYRKDRPYMLKYLFLIPALTVIFFNPVTHIMMEISCNKPVQIMKKNCNGNMKETSMDNKNEICNGGACENSINGMHKDSISTSLFTEMSNRLKLIFLCSLIRDSTLKMLTNPVILSTFFGIILNISFKAHVPTVLHRPINVVATIIPGLALSVLGFSMVGKERHIFSSSIILATVLIAVKMVLTPLVLFGFVKLLTTDQNQEELDFSILYGIVSPASGIFQAGEMYRLPVFAMSATLIISSFICFPLSYIIAKLCLITTYTLNDYVPSLRCIIYIVAIVTILCCLYVCTLILWKKKWRKPPCCYIFLLAFVQIWMSSGIIMWNVCDSSFQWVFQGELIFAFGGEMATYILTATLAIVITLERKWPLIFENRILVLMTSVFGLSILMTCVMGSLVYNTHIQDVLLFGEPRNYHERLELVVTTSTLGICLAIIGPSLLLYFRNKAPAKFRGTLSSVEQTGQKDIYLIDLNITDSPSNINESTTNKIAAFGYEDEEDLYYEEVVKTNQIKKYVVFGPQWTFRYVSLLILLWTSMTIKFLANILKLANCTKIAITVPLEYLQAILFTGQGVWTFLTFGCDLRTKILSLKKWFRKLRYGREELHLNTEACESSHVKKVCREFLNYYYPHSLRKLARERVWKKNHYRDSFWGHQMVEWLVRSGAVQDELEAVQYGRKLLLGGVICHVRRAHHFHDAPYLYHFVRKCETYEMLH